MVKIPPESGTLTVFHELLHNPLLPRLVTPAIDLSVFPSEVDRFAEV